MALHARSRHGPPSRQWVDPCRCLRGVARPVRRAVSTCSRYEPFPHGASGGTRRCGGRHAPRFPAWGPRSVESPRHAGGPTRLLDWEAADAEGMPLWDLFHFLRSFEFSLSKEAGRHDHLRSFADHVPPLPSSTVSSSRPRPVIAPRPRSPPARAAALLPLLDASRRQGGISPAARPAALGPLLQPSASRRRPTGRPWAATSLSLPVAP